MIPFDFEGENHQKTDFPDFPRDVTFCHFCNEISSVLALTTSYRMTIHYFARHLHSISVPLDKNSINLNDWSYFIFKRFDLKCPDLSHTLKFAWSPASVLL